jgi:hypothetical protein
MLNHSKFRRASYLIVAVAVALSLTGCITINKVPDTKMGSSPNVTSAAKQMPTAKVLYETMRKNVAAAKSVRIKGGVTIGGKKLTIDIAGDREGKNTRALVSDGTGEAELLTVGGSIYIKADTAYWTKNGSAAAAKVAAGKYVKVPAGTGVGDLKVGTLLDGAFTDLPLAGAFQKVEATDVDGTPAYLLADRLSPQDGQIYVSADGKARLLRIVSVKANAGTLDFSEWDAVPPKSPPPADQLVRIPGLG